MRLSENCLSRFLPDGVGYCCILTAEFNQISERFTFKEVNAVLLYEIIVLVIAPGSRFDWHKWGYSFQIQPRKGVIVFRSTVM